MSTWTTLADRPGYFGSRRDEIHARLDRIYGPGNWRLGWNVAGNWVDRLGMSMLYEDAYQQFLRENPDALEQLLAAACDVYDDAPSNMASGLDYLQQETGRTHVQDIAIRRCVIRLGRSFYGTQPIQIRDKDGEHPLSMTLHRDRCRSTGPTCSSLPSWKAGGSPARSSRSTRATSTFRSGAT